MAWGVRNEISDNVWEEWERVAKSMWWDDNSWADENTHDPNEKRLKWRSFHEWRKLSRVESKYYSYNFIQLTKTKRLLARARDA